MDSFADSVMGTLRKLRMSLMTDDENEDESKTQADGGEQGQGEHPKKDHKDHKDHGHHRQGKKHSNESNHSTGCKKSAPSYEPSKQGKDGTLLQIARHKPEGPNSETGKRTRSMRLANSMNSVYRKIRNDKNLHNDRHYLVAVTEHLKEEAPEHSGRHK